MVECDGCANQGSGHPQPGSRAEPEAKYFAVYGPDRPLNSSKELGPHPAFLDGFGCRSGPLGFPKWMTRPTQVGSTSLSCFSLGIILVDWPSFCKYLGWPGVASGFAILRPSSPCRECCQTVHYMAGFSQVPVSRNGF